MPKVLPYCVKEELRNGKVEDDSSRAVSGLSVSPDGSVVAVLIERWAFAVL